MNRWTQREIVTVAAIGVFFGAVYLAFVQVLLLLMPVIGPIAVDIMLGLWCTASVVAAYIIRKPGAAFFAEVVAAAAEVAMGTPNGLIILLTGVVQGAGVELPFALTRWKRYDWPVILASGVSVAIFSFVYSWIRSNYGALAPTFVALMFVIRVASCVVFAGVLGKYIGDALHRTGAVDGLGIDKNARAATI